MIVSIKLKDIVNTDKWDKFCKMFSISKYAVSQGLLDGEEEFTMTKEQAVKLGLIKGSK